MCSDYRSQLLFLFYENRPAKLQFQTLPFSANTRPEKIQTPPDRSATPYYVESFRFHPRVHRTKVQNIESIVLNLDSKPIFWIDCRQHEQCSSYFMKTNISEKLKSCYVCYLPYLPSPIPTHPNPSAGGDVSGGAGGRWGWGGWGWGWG